jgi:predicted neutral ceramidase superfamily lipid hydrolase
MSSPYAPPKSQILDTRAADEHVEKVRSGQRMLIWAILLYFGVSALAVLGSSTTSIAVSAAVGLLTLAGVLAMFAMSLMGLFRIWSGLQTSVIVRILLLFLLLIPLIGLLTLIAINGRATKFLRDNGYRVGLLGASPAR